MCGKDSVDGAREFEQESVDTKEVQSADAIEENRVVRKSFVGKFVN
jgi:hypothetical protein